VQKKIQNKESTKRKEKQIADFYIRGKLNEAQICELTGFSYEMVHGAIVRLELAKRSMEYSEEITRRVLHDKLPILKDITAVTLGKLQTALESIIPMELSVGDIVGLAKVIATLDTVTNLAEGKPTEIHANTPVTKEKIIEVFTSMKDDPVTNPDADLGVVEEVIPSDDEF